MDEVMEPTTSEQPMDVATPVSTQSGQGTITLLRNGEPTENVFNVSGQMIIGRFDPSVGPIDVDLGGLEEGSYVSRKHARIEDDNGTWKIVDLGSSNGTWVKHGNDFERVESGELYDGETFALGNAQFLFHCDTARPASGETEAPPEPVVDAAPATDPEPNL